MWATLWRTQARISKRGGRFNVRAIKVSFDGALGSGGAALLADYSDREGAGFLKHEDEVLAPMLEGALRSGIQVEFHAIGDRANRHTLDLFEKAFAKVPVSQRAVADPRWRIEHAQILHRPPSNCASEYDTHPLREKLIVSSYQP